MNILITCVGRLVEIIQSFCEAAEELKIELTILSEDISKDAPALCFCYKTKIVFKIKDNNYIPQLLAIWKGEK